MLDDLQSKGELGCFALTEVGAGVLSGFIVKTTATWDAAQDGFVIQTPDPSAEKNWISQVDALLGVCMLLLTHLLFVSCCRMW